METVVAGAVMAAGLPEAAVEGLHVGAQPALAVMAVAVLFVFTSGNGGTHARSNH
jgi:hypothetical protein